MILRSDQLENVPHPRFAPQIFGQHAAIGEFIHAAQGNLHHAWLITGQNGIGKASLAWRFAKTMLSGSSLHPDLPLDGDQGVLKRIEALTEPRLISVTRPYDEKAKRLRTAITVDEIRNLKQFFTLSVTDGGWRVAIIDAADELNPAASNALLKLLEEPPKRSLILLICHQGAKLLPTIKSRTRNLRLHPLAPQNLDAALTQAGYDFDTQEEALAELSQGSIGMAIRLLEQDGLSIYQQIVTLAQNAQELDRMAINTLANQSQGAQNQPRYALICELFQLFLARLARFGASQTIPTQSAQGERECFQNLAPHPQTAIKWAQLLSSIIDETNHAQAVNLDPAQVILDMFLQFESTAKG